MSKHRKSLLLDGPGNISLIIEGQEQEDSDEQDQSRFELKDPVL